MIPAGTLRFNSHHRAVRKRLARESKRLAERQTYAALLHDRGLVDNMSRALEIQRQMERSYLAEYRAPLNAIKLPKSTP